MSRGLKRKSENRLASCLLTMPGITVVPFALAIPGARFEPEFLLYMGIAAIVAAGRNNRPGHKCPGRSEAG